MEKERTPWERDLREYYKTPNLDERVEDEVERIVKVTDEKIAGMVRNEALIRDNDICSLESEAKQFERQGEIQTAQRLKLQAIELSQSPINFYGSHYYVKGSTVYRLNPTQPGEKQ